MSNNGMKVRVFDMEHGLVEYDDVKTIRIVSRDYNLLIMKDYLSVIGEIVGSVDIKGEELDLSFVYNEVRQGNYERLNYTLDVLEKKIDYKLDKE